MINKKYNIVVSGAAVLKPCCDNIKEISKELGKEVAKKGHTLVTGATCGVPYYAALGCKQAKGFNIGFSPASSEREHLKTYKLPIDVFDIMIYTGGDYTGRDVLMTKSADAVIIACGRIGTLHEFATAIETKKPVGVLEGTGGTADRIRGLIAGVYSRVSKTIVFESDPDILVDKLIKIVDKNKRHNSHIIK
ncbi:MAG: hypothetical protein MCSN_6550 [Candidatus Microsyncoccus archaeolyticus]|jgi:hypothetical protein|nr:MAG: hypothetical protein MCSN_6550 [Candidatus Parcubacteria bacterium]